MQAPERQSRRPRPSRPLPTPAGSAPGLWPGLPPSRLCSSCHILPRSEEDRRPEDCLEVVGELLGTEKVRLEEVILHPEPHRQPVERQDLVAPADVHRELLIAAELGPAHSREDIEAARHGVSPAEESLARQ